MRKLTHPEIMSLPNSPLSRSLPFLFSLNPKSAGDIVKAYPGAGNNLLLQVWNLICWHMSNKPIFVVDDDLAWALVNTKPPSKVFDLEPVLPANGMYLSLPPIFDILNEETGLHKVEGLYLVTQQVMVRKDGTMDSDDKAIHMGHPDYDAIMGITVYGIGEAKRLTGPDLWDRDDATVYFHMVPGKRLLAGGADRAGTKELANFTYNLLWILQNTAGVTTKSVVPKTKRAFKREQKIQLRKGKTAAPYSVLSLSSKERTKTTYVRGEGTERTVRAHLVLGHTHRYWVKDPGENPVLAEKDGRVLIAKWLLPYWKGDPTKGPSSPTRRRVTR